MVDPWVRTLGRATGSLVLVAGIVVLSVGTASAAPMPQADRSTMMPAAASGPQGHHVDIMAQPPPVDQDRRLANGASVREGRRTGRGELTIDNGADRDAVVTLAMSNSPLYSVYVRKGSKYTVTGIRDSTYEVFFATGTDWDSQSRSFTRDASYQRFDKTLDFTTTTTATERRWSTWNITLYPVVGGNATTSTVDQNDYPGA